MSRHLYTLFFLLFAASQVIATETLTLLNWEAYLSPKVIKQWELETGGKIEQVYFDNDEQRDSMLLSYQGGVIDLAVVDEMVAKKYGENNILEIVDWNSESPNTRYVSDKWQQRCSQAGSPYMYGTIGIVYRKDKVAKTPESWWDLLKPAPSLRGHIALLHEPADTLLPALLARGHHANTADKAALKQAFADTEKLLPYILTFEYPITYVSQTPSDNQLHMALAYSGDHHTLNEIQGTDHWDYVIPREGTLVWTDCLGILETSRNKVRAKQFVNFLNRPEIAAMNSEDIYFATPNQAAKGLQSRKFLSDKAINPSESELSSSRHYQFMETDNLKLRYRILQSLLVKYEAQ